MAQQAFGIALKLSGTKIGELIDISGPTITVDSIEITHHNQTNVFKQFMPGNTDGGEISGTMQMMNNNWLALYNATVNAGDTSFPFHGTTWPFILEFPFSGSLPTIAFSGFFTALNPVATGGVDDKITCDFTIKVTGQFALANLT